MVNSNFVPDIRFLASLTGALSWSKLDIANLSDQTEEIYPIPPAYCTKAVTLKG